MTDRITFDEKHWPIILVRYPAKLDPADFDRHISKVASYLQRNQAFALLNDSRGAGAPNASQRKDIAKLYDDHEAAVKKYWLGTAVVFDSPLIAGVLTALNWLRPPPHPFKAFTHYDEGMNWLQSLFDPKSQRVA